ncbi:MAG: hypothetical protein GY814_13960 [Gammaproteobacteria bacterium]|nr:hypothetical protein [Gammaproteobacteria bacterium]
MYAFNKRFRPTLWFGDFTPVTLACLMLTLVLWAFAFGAVTNLQEPLVALFLFITSIAALFLGVQHHKKRHLVRTEKLRYVGEGDSKTEEIFLNRDNAYADRYTWLNGFCIPDTDAEGLEHTDGSVSVALVWDGIATDLEAEATIEGQYKMFTDALNHLPEEPTLTVENHWLRAYDRTTCEDYLAHGQQYAKRHKDFGLKIRESIASLTAEMAMDNRVVVVMTLSRTFSPFAGIRPLRAQKKQRADGNRLYHIARDFAAQLPGARFLDYEDFQREMRRHYNREHGRKQRLPAATRRFKLSHMLAYKPEWQNGIFKFYDTYTKTLLLTNYPDANPNWFYQIANRCGCEIHVTQLISPVHGGSEIRKSVRQTEKAMESAESIGGENEQGKVRDHNDFRAFVAENDLRIFNNAYFIKLHHMDRDALEEQVKYFVDLIGSEYFAPSSEAMDLSYWRFSQLAQGYLSPFLRPDQMLQVANMAPIIRFKTGDTNDPQMLRITSDSQAITFGYAKDKASHKLTAAKTGSGKGVAMVAEACELFPLGVDFLFAEVGASYKWVVEAFGGTYFHLDPNTTVVSPFPDYALADASKEKHPLDSDVVAPTIGALMPLLVQGLKDRTNHVLSVAEQVMQLMYTLPDTQIKAPTLGTYHTFIEEAVNNKVFSGVQAAVAVTMEENLHSFLSSTTGAKFTEPNTLDFTTGIVGVDFKPLLNNPELMKFMLVFIALRYKHLAFASSRQTRIILDEQHVFNDIDPVLMTNLTKQLTRMGRKEAGSYHGISQEVLDLQLELGILNQISNRELLYVLDGHDQLAQQFKMNDTALARWKSYVDPEEAAAMHYRNGMRMVGKHCFDQHMQFPQILLDLADSSPRGLELKEIIGAQHKDPMERLRLFREAMSEPPVH